MDPRQSKQSICNQHGIRIYPVPMHGKYRIEIEFNKSPFWERRYQTEDPIRGSKYYAIDKKIWAEKIQELYEEFYETKVLPKIARDEAKRKQAEKQRSNRTPHHSR